MLRSVRMQFATVAAQNTIVCDTAIPPCVELVGLTKIVTIRQILPEPSVDRVTYWAISYAIVGITDSLFESAFGSYVE